MKELNLEVGKNAWSIQLGDCEVLSIKDDYYMLENTKGLAYIYYFDGKLSKNDFSPSLFLSNPFGQKLVQENKDGWIEPKESKSELINALCNARNAHFSGTILDTINDKLQKLLESI